MSIGAISGSYCEISQHDNDIPPVIKDTIIMKFKKPIEDYSKWIDTLDYGLIKQIKIIQKLSDEHTNINVKNACLTLLEKISKPNNTDNPPKHEIIDDFLGKIIQLSSKVIGKATIIFIMPCKEGGFIYVTPKFIKVNIGNGESH